MTAPYQGAVVGCIQTIPLSLPPNAALHITNIPNWANYRWIIVPLRGAVSASVTYIHEVDAAAAQSMSGPYDSGWWQSSAPVGYAPGDVIASADNYSKTWWTSRGLAVPVTRLGPAIIAPTSVPLGVGCTGVQIISFVYFGTFDSNTQNITFKTGNTTGLDLFSIDGGYYQDGPTGKIYRNSWQPPYVNSPYDPSALSLETIVGRVTKRGGLSVGDYDASDFASTMVAGYPIARQSNAAECLLPLLQAYFGYASEYEAKLNFKFYGADAAVTVDRADLIEGNDANKGAIVSNLRNQATEFPRRVVGSYMDPAQNYSVVDVAAERRSIDVVAIGDQSFQIPVVMTASDAAKAVSKSLKVTYATLEGALEYSTPLAGTDVYLALAAGEALQFQGKRYVADDVILSSGSIKLTTRYDRQSAYQSNVQAITGNSPSLPVVPYSGPTTLIPMNLPSLRPQDTYGVYLAAASSDGRASWAGCTVQVSYDGQVSWQNALTITQASTLGVLQLDEPGGGEPLTVQVIGDLETVTDAQIAANANAFALLNSAQVAEIGQFKTATAVGAPGGYELTNTTRGELGTTRLVGVAGYTFTMLDAIYFLPVDISFAGQTLYFRAVGFGEVAEDATVISIAYAPSLTTIHDGGTVTT